MSNNENNRIVLSPVKRNPNNINNKYSEFIENIEKQLGEIVEIGIDHKTYNICIHIPLIYELDYIEITRTDFFGSGKSFEDACEDYTYKLYESKNLRYNKAILILPESPFMTNENKIKNSNTEDLAKIMFEFCKKFNQDNFQPHCIKCTEDDCNLCIEKWLKEEINE